MLERLRELISENRNRDSFFKLIGRHFPKVSVEFLLIERAYDVASIAFSEKYRDSGAKYFEHLLAVAVIVVEYLRVRDANIIAAALLHDIIEDIDGWTQERLAIELNREISQNVWWVTKPDVSEHLGDKEARNRAYHQKLGDATRDSMKIKLADRLHNMITLWSTNEEKQRRKVRETQDFYLSLAEKHTLLIHELEEAIHEVMNSWDKT